MLQIMVPYNYTEFIDDLTMLVKNNFVPMSRIDDAVERILRVKFVMGLFENPFPDLSMAKYLGHQVSWPFIFVLMFFWVWTHFLYMKNKALFGDSLKFKCNRSTENSLGKQSENHLYC